MPACPRRAFTLIELLVVLSIIALLMSILLPTLQRVRDLAVDAECANNLHQIIIATNTYLVEEDGLIYWRGNQWWVTDPVAGGMDWYVYGGRETGNNPSQQSGFFNALQPRPLNPYFNDYVDSFRCPYDNVAWDWAGFETHFEFVGNSYTFNTYGFTGSPTLPTSPLGPDFGLAGINIAAVEQAALTVMYLDTSLHKSPESWHREEKGNIAFVDGHVLFMKLPLPFDDFGYTWNWRD